MATPIDPIDARDRSRILERIRDVEGVRRAGLDPDEAVLWVEREPRHQQPVEPRVRNALASLDLDSPDLHTHTLELRITLAAPDEPRRRVRFVGVDRKLHDAGRTASVAVRLEWGDDVFEGTASGEAGAAVELRTAAAAAIAALERLIDEPLDLRVIGAKPVRAFDSDLMVASVLHGSGAPRPLIGAVVVEDEPLAAVALAVLSALNRVLGNYLHTTD